MYRDLIAVTNRHLCSRPFTEQITRVCKLHPKALILREKDLPEEEYFSLARQVKEICEQFKVPFIPHFYPAVARELGCDRLHLPLPLLLENPKVVSDFHTVGTSIHSVSEAVKAEKLGASYLTAGHIYVTDCKKGLPPRGLPFLQNVCQAVQIPVYGIGGIKIFISARTQQVPGKASLTAPRTRLFNSSKDSPLRSSPIYSGLMFSPGILHSFLIGFIYIRDTIPQFGIGLFELAGNLL